MTVEEFRATLGRPEPLGQLSAPLAALWWDAKGDWARAHGMVDDLETPDAMAVHAYLHPKRARSGMPSTGTHAPGANSTGRRLMRSGRRWWRD